MASQSPAPLVFVRVGRQIKVLAKSPSGKRGKGRKPADQVIIEQALAIHQLYPCCEVIAVLRSGETLQISGTGDTSILIRACNRCPVCGAKA